MTPWDIPPHRLATVAPTPPKPARNWVWWVDRTLKTCAAISIVCVALAYLIGA